LLEGWTDLVFGQLPQFLPQFLTIIRCSLLEQVRVVLFKSLAHGPKGFHSINVLDI
jgi:hypothetical protein